MKMRKNAQVVLAVLAVTAVVVAGCAPLQAGPTEKTVYVGPTLVDCEGVAPQQCMLVKESLEGDWTLYYDQIEGFVHEEGFDYRLRISEEEVQNPPADASSIRWVLVEVLDKSRSLEGTRWTLDSYLNSEGVLAKALPSSEATAEFRAGSVGGNASCNSFFGSYEIDGEELSVELGGMTEMYCAPEELMEQEGDYLAALGSAASYSIVEDLLQIESSDGTPVLTYLVLQAQPLVGTTWQLTGYNNGKGGFSSVLAGTEITALFANDGQLGGSAGCNNYATSYEVDGSAISIGPVASTMMACPEPNGVMDQEGAYLAALEGAATFEIEGDTMRMTDADGTVMLGYAAQEPASLEGTAWQVISYNNGEEALVSPLAGTEITASFGEDGQLTGSAGCNNYFASYETDAGQISIGPVGSTMMMCNNPPGMMDQETAYMAALEASTTYSIQSDQLRMTDAEGTTTLTFAPLESTPLGRRFQAQRSRRYSTRVPT
jgi:heat shock protein HslJ